MGLPPVPSPLFNHSVTRSFAMSKTLRNLKRWYFFGHAQRRMHKKHPHLQRVPASKLHIMMVIHLYGRPITMITIRRLSAKFVHTFNPNEFYWLPNNGYVIPTLVGKTKLYTLSPKGYEYLSLLDKYLRTSRIDR
jgi:hypothetical protein